MSVVNSAVRLTLPTVGFFMDIWQADKYEREARNVNYETFSLVESAMRKRNSQCEKLDSTLKKLANRKRGIMSGTLPKFIAVHEKIIQINFSGRLSVDEIRNLALRPENLSGINQMISVSGIQMSDKEILGTFLFSFEYSGIGGAIKKDAKINLDVAYTRSDEAEVIAHNIDTERIAVEGINDKAEAVLKLLAQMNVLLLKSIQHTSAIIDRNGFDVNCYSNADIDDIMNCCNFAKATSDILKAPLFDSNGKLSRQIETTLSTGNEYIRRMQAVK